MPAVKNAVAGGNGLSAGLFLLHLGIRWFHDILGFESGAMVKVLGLSDSEWKDAPIIHMIWCTMVIGNNRFILEYLKG